MARYIDADLEVSDYVTVWDCDCSEFGKQTVMAVDDLQYLPTADVVPKSEVEKWYHEYHEIKDELKQEKMYHRETEKLADKYFAELQTCKTEVAREIFAEIATSMSMRNISTISIFALDIAKLKKKYTEEKT